MNNDPLSDSSRNELSGKTRARTLADWLTPISTGVGDLVQNSFNLAGHALGRGRSFGSSVAISVSGLSSDLLQSTSWLYDGATAIGDTATQFVGETFERLLNGAIYLSRQAGQVAEVSLDTLAGHPGQEQSYSAKGIRMALGLLPIIGNTQGYAQARLRYRTAQEIEDAAMREKALHEARRDCLIICAALSLEIATLGASGKVNAGLKAGSTILSMLNLTKVAREESAKSKWLPKMNIDILSAQADRALEFGILRDAMDIVLAVDMSPSTAETSSRDPSSEK